MALTPHQQRVTETFCNQCRPGKRNRAVFDLENFNNWLAACSEPPFTGTEQEFLSHIREAGFDPERLRV